MKTYICEICGDVGMEFFISFCCSIFSGAVLDGFYECATINSAKTTRPDPQGHGGF